MKQECENCGDKHDERLMISTPDCKWICMSCFAEDPDSYGFDIDLDSEDN